MNIQHTISYFPILGKPITSENSISLDLTQHNPQIVSCLDGNDLFCEYISNICERNNALCAVGGYGEDRNIYSRHPLFSNSGNDRSIHLGIDIWVPQGGEIFAPCNGIVHSFQNNNAEGDYGPTIIIDHGDFFILYGHLSLESLEGLEVGQIIQSGTMFASIGNSDENGGWPPHVHVQIITDMLGREGDFPGVCSRDEWSYWQRICPDPSDLLFFRSS